MICTSCNKTVDSIITTLKRGELVTGCKNCLSLVQNHGQNDISRHKRQADYRDHAQDIVQPMEGKAYLKARGIDRAREVGFSDEDIRQLF